MGEGERNLEWCDKLDLCANTLRFKPATISPKRRAGDARLAPAAITAAQLRNDAR